MTISPAARLEALDLAGARVPHERAQNLGAVARLLQGEPFYTFGITAVALALREGRLDQRGVLGDIARLTGCSPDPDQRTGPGYIDPQRTLGGLRCLADSLAEACAGHRRVVFGTGHPGSLLGFWQPLATWAGSNGASLVTGPAGMPVGPGQFSDWLGGVGVVSDGAGLMHHHGSRPAETVLDQDVDLVFGDHGWAGAAINAGLRCVALMDTNDPGLAVAAGLGSPGLTIVPCGDNSPNGAMGEVADWVIRRAGGQPGPLD